MLNIQKCVSMFGEAENYLAYSLLSSSSLPLVEVKLKHTITISGPFVKTNVLRGACQNVGFAGQRVIYVNSKVLKVSNNVGGEFPPPPNVVPDII